MNWLTARFAEFESFRDLYDNSSQFSNSPMRQLPLKYLQDALRSSGVEVTFDRVQEQSHNAYLYVEDEISATRRIERARPTYIGDERGIEPLRFTTAINDGRGAVLYLPDDDTDDLDIQLFAAGRLERIARLQLSGEITPSSADLSRARLVAPEVCSDGPCADWGEECGGDGCRCHKFPDVEPRVRGRLARVMRFRRSGLNVVVLKCHRDG